MWLVVLLNLIFPALVWFALAAFGLFWIGAFVAAITFLANIGAALDAAKGA